MKRFLIVVGILVLVGLGFWFISSMTGGVVSGVGDAVVVEESFRISDFGDVSFDEGEVNVEDLNESQNSSG